MILVIPPETHSSRWNGSSTDTLDSSSSSYNDDFQFLFSSDEEMSSSDSLSSASLLPFWRLAEEVTGLQSLVVTINFALPVCIFFCSKLTA